MKVITLLMLTLCLVQCTKQENKRTSKVKYLKENPKILQPEPYAMDSKPLLIKDARIMTAAGTVYEKASLLMEKE